MFNSFNLMALFIIFSLSLTSCKRGTTLYIGGDDWGKIKLTKDTFKDLNSIEKEAFFRSAKVILESEGRVGTAFYIGQGVDGFLFLTNYHVLKGKEECQNVKILSVKKDDESFKKVTLKCHTIIDEGTFDQGSDYTIFSVLENSKSGYLRQFKNIAIQKDNRVGDKLFFIGFGGGSSEARRYDGHISNDKDCLYLLGKKTISLDNFLVKDTIFTACDTRAGDSGSAIINARTGNYVGLLFGSATYNKDNPLGSDEIRENLGHDYLEFVTNSSWAIDASTVNFTRFFQ